MANPSPKMPRLNREDYIGILDMPSKAFRAAKAQLSVAEREELTRVWQEESKEAFESANGWIEEHGIPFADLRKF